MQKEISKWIYMKKWFLNMPRMEKASDWMVGNKKAGNITCIIFPAPYEFTSIDRVNCLQKEKSY